MKFQDRAFFATSIFVYPGAVSAGLARHGIETIPTFTFIFILWLYIARPEHWPHSKDVWLRPQTIIPLIIMICGQFLLAASCVVVGAGMAGIAEIHLAMPLAVCAVISLLGVLTAKGIQIHNSHLAQNSVLREISNPPSQHNTSHVAEYVDTVLMHISEHGQNRASREEVLQIVRAIEKADMARPVLNALATANTGRPVYTQIQSMLALRPKVAKSLKGEGFIEIAVTRALSTWAPQIIEDTAKDALLLLRKVPNIANELPKAIRFEAAARSITTGSPEAAKALMKLSRSLGTIQRA